MRIRAICFALLLIGAPAHAKDVTVQVNGLPVRLDITAPAPSNVTDPTIVFESGLGTAGTDDFALVLSRLPNVLRTVRYDRPGLGGSADDGASPTPRHIATVLHDALAAAGVPPPTPRRTPRSTSGTSGVRQHASSRRETYDDGGEEPNLAAESDPRRSAWHRRCLRLLPEIQALPPLRSIPIVVLAGASDTEWPTSMPVSFDMRRWVRQWLSVRNASLQRFAAGLARGTFVETTGSSHQIQTSEPELIAWAIDRVLLQR